MSVLKLLNFILNLIVFSFLNLSCFAQKNMLSTRNSSKYMVEYKTNNSNLSIFGKVVDIISKEPIPGAKVELGCGTTVTDSLGFFKFDLKKDLKDIYLKCSFIGYQPIETHDFNLNHNSIKLDFFLSLDDRPMIDCPQIFKSD